MLFRISSRVGFEEFPYIIDNACCTAAISKRFTKQFQSIKLITSNGTSVLLEIIVHYLRYNPSIRTEPFGLISDRNWPT